MVEHPPSKKAKTAETSDAESVSSKAAKVGKSTAIVAKRRTYDEEMAFITQIDPVRFRIAPGFVPGMAVPGLFFVNDALKKLMFDELQHAVDAEGIGGFLPAVKQIANVASLPGIVKVCGRLRKKKKEKAKKKKKKKKKHKKTCSKMVLFVFGFFRARPSLWFFFVFFSCNFIAIWDSLNALRIFFLSGFHWRFIC
jgi:hypothetical protein